MTSAARRLSLVACAAGVAAGVILLTRELRRLVVALKELQREARLPAPTRPVSPPHTPPHTPPRTPPRTPASALATPIAWRDGWPAPPTPARARPPTSPAAGPFARPIVTAIGAPDGEGCAASAGSIFAVLPREALVRVLEALPPSAQLQCERVCREWRGAVLDTPLWKAWRRRRASLSEAALSLPGKPVYAFGSAPADVPADVRAAGERASGRADALPASELLFASCSAQWTVLGRPEAGAAGHGAAGPPVALLQHQARDFLLSCCPASGLAFSGDRDSQIRVWDARSGRLVGRVPFPGSSVTALANCGRHLLAADSQASCLHARPFDDGFLSGGADGAVRLWSADRVVAQARRAAGGSPNGAETDAAGGPRAGTGGAGRVDLGLWAIGSASPVSSHCDSVTCLARDETYAASGSREGSVHVALLPSGEPHLEISGCGQINCLALHRGKLVICADDGHHASLCIWDVARSELVQELGGVRKWSSPTSFAYFGYSGAFWVRDATLFTLKWIGDEGRAAEGAAEGLPVLPGQAPNTPVPQFMLGQPLPDFPGFAGITAAVHAGI